MPNVGGVGVVAAVMLATASATAGHASSTLTLLRVVVATVVVGGVRWGVHGGC